MASVDLNADLGEGDGSAGLLRDLEILQQISSANVACGGHAGSLERMRQLAVACQELGVAFGAHPSFCDREGFGRSRPTAIPADLQQQLQQQLQSALTAAAAVGIAVHHVKPHGALYHVIEHDPLIADLFLAAVQQVLPGVRIVGISGGRLVRRAAEQGWTTVQEFFADREYEADGRLRERHLESSVVTDHEQICHRALIAVREGQVNCFGGGLISVTAETICVHGDHADSVAAATALRRALEQSGIRISSAEGPEC